MASQRLRNILRRVLRGLVAACALSGATLVQAAGPDLIIDSLDATGVAADPQTLDVSGALAVRVQNQGAAASPAAFDVLVFEDGDGDGRFGPGSDTALGSTAVAAGLVAGGELLMEVPLAGRLRFAGNLLHALADPNDVVVEDQETNNTRHTGQASVFIPEPGIFDPVLEWSWTSSAIQPNALNVMMTPAVVDLNADGVPDVVFASTASTGGGLVERGFLRALSGADGSELFTVTDSTLQVSTTSSVAVGDIDGDSRPEILASDTSGARLVAFEHDGAFKWRSPLLEAINWGAPSIADLDADGVPEIVVGRQVLDAAGTVLWTGTGGRGALASGSVGPLSLVADIDLDGRPEVVAGNTVYRVDGSILWQAAGPDGYPAVGDFDADAFAEVVLVAEGFVRLVDHDGTLLWGPVAVPGGGKGGPPTIADYDADGEPEIGIAGARRYFVLETDGSLKWQAVTQDVSSNVTGSSVFDFEGDGAAEVVYRDELSLRVYRGTDGQVLFETPMSSCTWHEYVLVADVDADGGAEIVAVANNNCGKGPQRGVFVFGDAAGNWVPTRSIWNQFSYHITNVNADATIPAVEQNNWQVPGLNNFRLNEFAPGEGSATAAPDLVPSFIRSNAESCPLSVDLTARVGNGGSAPAPAGMPISVYHGDPAAGGVLLGVVPTTGALRPGEFEDITVTWDDPPAGLQQIFVVADDDGSGAGRVKEGDETNNTHQAGVSVCAQTAAAVSGLFCRAKSTKVAVGWSLLDGAVSYRVTRHAPDASTVVAEQAANGFTDFGLTDGITYTYTVTAVLASGAETLASGPCSATPLPLTRDRNRPPAFVSTPPTEGGQGQPYAYDAEAVDPEDEAVSFALSLAPAGMTLDTASGVVAWTPAASQVGAHLVTVEARDSGNRVSSQTWRIGVGDVNDPPRITSTAPVTATATLAYRYPVTAEDADGDPLLFALIQAPAGMGIDRASGLVRWTPTGAQTGEHSVTVRVGDGKGAFDSQSFQVSVAPPPNNPPRIVSAPVTGATVGVPYAYDVEALDDDPGEALTFALETAPAGMQIDPASGLIAWTPIAGAVGDRTVRVVVTDAAGATAAQEFTVTVTAANAAPAITSVAPTGATAGQPYGYNVEAIDPDAGDTLLFALTAAPAGMTIDAVTGLIQWTPAVGQIGPNTVAVRVSDGSAATDVQSFVVTVAAPNTPPSITSAPVVLATEGVPYAYPVAAADPDPADTLTFALDAAPAGMSIDAASGLVQWTPTGAQLGANPVTVRVTDSAGALATQNFSVEVAPANQPPAFISLPPTTATQGQLYRYDAEAADPDTGDTLTFSLTLAPAGMTVDVATGLVEWTPTASQLGLQDVTVSVTDAAGAVATQSFSIDVAAGNAAPTITSTPALVATEGEPYAYDVEATDPDAGDILTFALDVAPAGMTVDPASGLIQWTPAAGQVGDSPVTVRVTDAAGAFATQSFIVAVVAGNAVPAITSTPVLGGTGGEPYVYDVAATDPDAGDALTFSLSAAPAGMSIDPATGLIQWTPVTGQVGDNPVSVLVSDGAGGSASQSFTVSVAAAPANQTPAITSAPVTSGVADQLYVYAASATDPDGDSLTFSLPVAPAGMSVDPATGRVTWTPATAQVGDHPVTVRVADGQAFAQQSYTVTVTDVALPLEISVSASPAIIDVGQTTTITVTTQGGTGSIASSLAVNGSPVALDADGQAVVTGDAIGAFELQALATDAVETVGANGLFTVRDPADVTAPVARIDTPADETEVTAPVNIIGTASDANLAEYRLLLTPAGANDFDEIGRGTAAVTAGVLGTLDPSLLRNGLYDLVLVVRDVNGAETTSVVTYRVEGDLKVGNFSITLEDLNIPMLGLPIRVTRTYDSRRRSEDLDFGFGWSVGYQDTKVEETRAPGSGWALNEIRSGPFGVIATFCVQPLGDPQVSVTLPDGEVETFDVRVTPECNQFSPILDVDVIFQPTAGTTSTLRVAGTSRVRFNGGRLLDTGDFVSTFDPDRYVLTSADGLELEIEQGFGLRTARDRDGETLSFSHAGIVHSAGKSVVFERDTQGRITTVIDPAGNRLTYRYDGRGDLAASTNRVGDTTTYGYNRSHGLLNINDPLGRRLVRNIYDAGGRLVAQEDNLGNRTDFAHDLTGRQSVVTDRLGRATVFQYNERGDVITEIDALGNLTTHTYDANGNRLSTTNPLGETTRATYDARFNQLTSTDALGNTTSFTYNAFGQELTVTDPQGETFTSVYDPFGNLLTVTDPAGNVSAQNINAEGLVSQRVDAEGGITRFSYDGDGNVTQRTDPLGNVTTFTYDGNGNRLTETRTRTLADGSVATEVTRFAYDAADRLVATTDPLGNVTRTEYDAVGNEVARIDVLGRRTEFVYDAFGRLIRTIHPDGTVSTRDYDAEGNLVAETDSLGRTTTHGYDALNRQIRTTYPDGGTTRIEYDAAGRVIAQTDERGNVTRHDYDAAGRRIRTTDALGNVTTFGFDPEGKLLTVTDPLGRTTERVYDALDRLVRTVFPDTTETATEYDALGRPTAQVDESGLRTGFAYDALGRLTAVTDALGGVTRFEYDEGGNKTAQTDGLGRRTEWSYDALGRVLRHTLPLGQTETFDYDAAGNRIARTDFLGRTTTFGYDIRDRLVSRSFADGSLETLAYDAGGNRIAVTDASGTQRFAYDPRDRLIRDEKPDGTVLSYGYDLTGNRTSLTSRPAGELSDQTQNFAFDALNRLTAVTDHTGAVTRYGYDAAGNRVSLAYPNGLTTRYQYDLRNRLTEIETTDALGGVVARFAYALDPTGRRTRETQHGGRTTDYGHDALYRLVSETLTHSGVTTRSASYQYDAVGNRTRSEVDGVATLYSYDANDRLLSAGGTSYRYDAQGNLLSEEDGADETRYAYDQRDRLIQADEFSGGAAAGSVALAYDFDGNRIARTQAGITTGFVVDANRGFTQVLQETDGSGALQATYTLGAERISQHRGGEVRHYHADALGSTRLLTDAAGTETDAYAYEAFGELLSRSGTTDNPFRFSGEAFDPALGLYDLRARYYEPALGRFTQRDTFPGFEQRPLSLNEYLYADADPVNNIDPSGRFSLAGFGAGFSIQGALMTTAVGAAGASLLAAVISIDDPDRIIARKRARTRWDVIIGGFQVRRCVVSREKRCRANIPVLLLGADNLQQTRHVFDAQEAGIGVTPLKRKFRKFDDGGFFRKSPECKGKIGGMSGRDCDEYPYASTFQGGRVNYSAGRVSLRAIDSGHNQGAGRKLGVFYSDCGVSKTNDLESWFGVVALPSAPTTRWRCDKR